MGDKTDRQPTAQPAYRYPVTDATGTVIAYDLHPPEHYHHPPTADYWRERANAAEVLGVQQWMALDLGMALGHREHPAPNENGGRGSWADWWSELLVEVRDLTATAVLHDYEIKSGRECCPCGAAASRHLAERDAAREDLEVADGLAVMYADLRDEALENAMNAEATLGRVRLLHTPEPEETRPDEEPESRCMECLTQYPCETVRALDGVE